MENQILFKTEEFEKINFKDSGFLLHLEDDIYYIKKATYDDEKIQIMLHVDTTNNIKHIRRFTIQIGEFTCHPAHIKVAIHLVFKSFLKAYLNKNIFYKVTSVYIHGYIVVQEGEDERLPSFLLTRVISIGDRLFNKRKNIGF